jgi:CheY-like chemotaxis protein
MAIKILQEPVCDQSVYLRTILGPEASEETFADDILARILNEDFGGKSGIKEDLGVGSTDSETKKGIATEDLFPSLERMSPVVHLQSFDVLLVEDSAADAEITMRALRKCSPLLSIFWVKDGPDALDFVYGIGAYELYGPSTALKLVLLDLSLTKLNGFEVLKRIRGDESTRLLPVIIWTGSNSEKDIEEARFLGVNAYLTKPVDTDDFARQISESIAPFFTKNGPVISTP